VRQFLRNVDKPCETDGGKHEGGPVTHSSPAATAVGGKTAGVLTKARNPNIGSRNWKQEFKFLPTCQCLLRILDEVDQLENRPQEDDAD